MINHVMYFGLKMVVLATVISFKRFAYSRKYVAELFEIQNSSDTIEALAEGYKVCRKPFTCYPFD